MITNLKWLILCKLKLKVTKDSFLLRGSIFIEAISCPKIYSLSRYQKYHFAENNYDHLRNINLLKHTEGDSASIDLLIGNDFYYSFINRNFVKGQKDEPIAKETYCGSFIFSGVFIDKNNNKESSVNFNSTHVLR